jgi:streptogramin lyase
VTVELPRVPAEAPYLLSKVTVGFLFALYSTAALLTQDSLWASSDLGVVRFELETGDAEIFPLTGIRTVNQAADGQIWFGGEWILVRFDPDTGDWEEFEIDPGPIPSWLVTDIEEDQKVNIHSRMTIEIRFPLIIDLSVFIR